MSRGNPLRKMTLHLVHTWRNGCFHYYNQPGVSSDEFAPIVIANNIGVLTILELRHIDIQTYKDYGELFVWTYLNDEWSQWHLACVLANEINHINEIE